MREPACRRSGSSSAGECAPRLGVAFILGALHTFAVRGTAASSLALTTRRTALGAGPFAPGRRDDCLATKELPSRPGSRGGRSSVQLTVQCERKWGSLGGREA